MPRKYTTEERIAAFWSKVNKDGSIPEHRPELGKCWEWGGRTNRDGYGQFRNYKIVENSHRFAWRLHNGDIAEFLKICHKCDNRKCCNPNHLFIGTHQDNMADMYAKGRNNQVKGENHPSHKLTDKQVEEIRTRYASGNVRQVDLAKEYNVIQPHISRIILRISR